MSSIVDYHQLSKHAFDAYAPGPGRMDWATQPEPFLRFEGTSVEPCSGRIGELLFHSLAISAWKQAGGNRWALRVNPSSGNLHPTEGYVITGSGLYHYRPDVHALELRAELSGVPSDFLAVGLTSILWREAWKYGERAYRYCQHDAGHAIAAVAISAAALGLETVLVDRLGHAELSELLGTGPSGDESEEPECLLALVPPGSSFVMPPLKIGALLGTANRLSPHHAHAWPRASEARALCRKPSGLGADSLLPFDGAYLPVVRQRRSAVDFDGRTRIPAAGFHRFLERTRLPGFSQVDLGLFVHRVDGVEPGLYLYHRDSGVLECLRAGDAREAAMHLSCHQEIAADGAFAVAMLARFDLSAGSWRYPRLFWECGMIGQLLYLEAETQGIRGTGIGCYFDDPTHGVFGIGDMSRQSLYHFTVGGPVEDGRILG